MFNDDPSTATLKVIADAHRQLGTTRLLPTLITASEDKTRSAIAATIAAIESGTSGIAGLHLEGPHLSVKKKGVHNDSFIRPMEKSDVDLLIEAAARLPVLKVTIAPENVTLAQTKTLSDAGILLSLGHTDAAYDTCIAYQQAGVRCVTHLFLSLIHI